MTCCVAFHQVNSLWVHHPHMLHTKAASSIRIHSFINSYPKCLYPFGTTYWWVCRLSAWSTLWRVASGDISTRKVTICWLGTSDGMWNMDTRRVDDSNVVSAKCALSEGYHFEHFDDFLPEPKWVIVKKNDLYTIQHMHTTASCTTPPLHLFLHSMNTSRST